jgi:hypothetical protein
MSEAASIDGRGALNFMIAVDRWLPVRRASRPSCASATTVQRRASRPSCACATTVQGLEPRSWERPRACD